MKIGYYLTRLLYYTIYKDKYTITKRAKQLINYLAL